MNGCICACEKPLVFPSYLVVYLCAKYKWAHNVVEALMNSCTMEMVKTLLVKRQWSNYTEFI